MSSNVPITPSSNITAPTPQNTPLTHAPIGSANLLSRPQVPSISEVVEGDDGDDDEDDDDDEDEDGLQATTAAAALQSMVTAKLASLIGKSSGYVENLPLDVRRSVEALKGVQVKQVELRRMFRYESLELERKYLALTQPLYARRRAILTGTSAPSLDEITLGEAESKRDAELSDELTSYKPLPPSSPNSNPTASNINPAAIPEFWLTALRNHAGIASLITDRDADALKYLEDIGVEYLPSPSSSASNPPTTSTPQNPGFTLLFHFSPQTNPYFTNRTLTKTYYYSLDIGYSGDFVYERAEGCEIYWRKGEGEDGKDMDLTREWEVRRQRNKNTNRTRLIRKAHPVESFFNFFSPPQLPESLRPRTFSGPNSSLSTNAKSKSTTKGGENNNGGGNGDNELDEEELDLDEEALEELEASVEIDYEIGEDIKERIIPHAVDYFTGKALAFEEDLVDEDEDEDEDDEDEDDDEDDEEDIDLDDVDDLDEDEEEEEEEEDDDEEEEDLPRSRRRLNTTNKQQTTTTATASRARGFNSGSGFGSGGASPGTWGAGIMSSSGSGSGAGSGKKASGGKDGKVGKTGSGAAGKKAGAGAGVFGAGAGGAGTREGEPAKAEECKNQ